MAVTVIGTGEVTRERIIASLSYGAAPDGTRGLSVNFTEQVLKDGKPVNEKKLGSWNFPEAQLSVIPELNELITRIDELLKSDTQADSLTANMQL